MLMLVPDWSRVWAGGRLSAAPTAVELSSGSAQEVVAGICWGMVLESCTLLSLDKPQTNHTLPRHPKGITVTYTNVVMPTACRNRSSTHNLVSRGSK